MYQGLARGQPPGRPRNEALKLCRGSRDIQRSSARSGHCKEERRLQGATDEAANNSRLSGGKNHPEAVSDFGTDPLLPASRKGVPFAKVGTLPNPCRTPFSVKGAHFERRHAPCHDADSPVFRRPARLLPNGKPSRPVWMLPVLQHDVDRPCSAYRGAYIFSSAAGSNDRYTSSLLPL